MKLISSSIVLLNNRLLGKTFGLIFLLTIVSCDLPFKTITYNDSTKHLMVDSLIKHQVQHSSKNNYTEAEAQADYLQHGLLSENKDSLPHSAKSINPYAFLDKKDFKNTSSKEFVLHKRKKPNEIKDYFASALKSDYPHGNKKLKSAKQKTWIEIFGVLGLALLFILISVFGLVGIFELAWLKAGLFISYIIFSGYWYRFLV